MVDYVRQDLQFRFDELRSRGWQYRSTRQLMFGKDGRRRGIADAVFEANGGSSIEISLCMPSQETVTLTLLPTEPFELVRIQLRGRSSRNVWEILASNNSMSRVMLL